ncbi:MAG: hypothetical protein F6K55_21460 [Moorea sp. SIO4A3]|nr:hypothetical protein [Moorena sp. SIO4A3]
MTVLFRFILINPGLRVSLPVGSTAGFVFAPGDCHGRESARPSITQVFAVFSQSLHPGLTRGC